MQERYVQGLPADDKHKLIHHEVFKMAAYVATHRLMCLDEPPTAVFLLTDLMAPGVYNAVSNHGMSIPNDLSVVGFDDNPLCLNMSPTLSTVTQPSRQIGIKAAKMIESLIAGMKIEKSVSLNGKLIPRESTRKV